MLLEPSIYRVEAIQGVAPKPREHKLKSVVRKVMNMLSRDEQGRIVKNTKLMRDQNWIEFFDPRHRRPHELKPFFEEWKETSKATMSFWEFLQAKEKLDPKLLDAGIQIRFLTSQERAAYAVSFRVNQQGQASLYYPDGSLLGDGTYIFVKGPDSVVYVGCEVRGQFHHSSFFAGKSVKAAGELIIHGGVLVEASSRSGHYRPDRAENARFLRYLDDQGVKRETYTFIEYFKNKEIY